MQVLSPILTFQKDQRLLSYREHTSRVRPLRPLDIQCDAKSLFYLRIRIVELVNLVNAAHIFDFLLIWDALMVYQPQKVIFHVLELLVYL